MGNQNPHPFDCAQGGLSRNKRGEDGATDAAVNTRFLHSADHRSRGNLLRSE